ncbi:MAG: hypothetical protein ACLQIB_21990 [Isosphaeraceae bacterium]
MQFRRTRVLALNPCEVKEIGTPWITFTPAGSENIEEAEAVDPAKTEIAVIVDATHNTITVTMGLKKVLAGRRQVFGEGRVEAGPNKPGKLARLVNLPVAKPAAITISSRLPYALPVEPQAPRRFFISREQAAPQTRKPMFNQSSYGS